MSKSLQPALSDFLTYLSEIGYGDLYLRPRAALPLETAEPAPPRRVAPVVSAGAVAAVAAPVPATPEIREIPAAPETPETPETTDRVEQLAALGLVAAGCTRCRLAEGRQKVVFGSGNPTAELMLVGEGPGAEEDRQGLPFVGAAGELLTRIIQAIELTREDVYIANVVKCRPPGNRDPEPDEVAACRGYLEQQIALVQPRVLVALGKVAAQTLLGNPGGETSIGRMRGQWYEVRGIPTMVTYHPAALLRNPALKRPTWEDMQQVRDRLRAGA